jgi:uncharacterized membrane protein YidH (DUF202 family)
MSEPTASVHRAATKGDPKRARDHLANERTFLAWVRTGIAIVVFGFAIGRFAIAMRQFAFTIVQLCARRSLRGPGIQNCST